MEETKITKNTSMSGIISAVSKMQEMYPNEKLMIIPEGYWDKIKSETYQQGKADAIEECIKHIKLYKYNDGTYVVYDEILDEIAEQLKENNNG